MHELLECRYQDHIEACHKDTAREEPAERDLLQPFRSWHRICSVPGTYDGLVSAVMSQETVYERVFARVLIIVSDRETPLS